MQRGQLQPKLLDEVLNVLLLSKISQRLKVNLSDQRNKR